MQLSELQSAYQPQFPDHYRPGVGIIGTGGIVRAAHLPAYKKYNVNVVGAYDISSEALQQAQQILPSLTPFNSLEELLERTDIEIVDIATHPQQRVGLIRAALAAGKHVLSQKPFAPDIQTAQELVEEAKRRGLKLAINQNGRWSPPWRLATLLVQQGAIGHILAATHLFEMSFSWRTGTVFDTIEHATISDYSIHWIDIIRCWLEEHTLMSVRAQEYFTPNQPPESKTPWGMWAEFAYEDGASGLIRCIGGTNTLRNGHLFWIHGTEGTIRGSVLGHDHLELEHHGIFSRFELQGEWFPDGMAGTMAELINAIAESREPYHSASHNLLSLAMTLAACRSTEQKSRAIHIEEFLA